MITDHGGSSIDSRIADHRKAVANPKVEASGGGGSSAKGVRVEAPKAPRVVGMERGCPLPIGKESGVPLPREFFGTFEWKMEKWVLVHSWCYFCRL